MMLLHMMFNKIIKVGYVLILELLLLSCSHIDNKTEFLLSKKISYIDNSTIVSEYKYDSQNNLSEEFIDGKIFRTYKYDNDNNVIEVFFEDGKIINEYSNILIVTSKTYTLDGNIRDEISYIYDSNNLKTEKVATNADGITKCNYAYDNKNLISEKCTLNDEPYIEYKYEYKNGNIYKTEIFKNGILDQIIINEYKGNLKTQAEYTLVNQNFKIYEFYEYDKNNNLIKLYMQESDNPKELIEEYSYIEVKK